GEKGTALQAASHGGHAKVVGQLLQAGADVNLQGGEYGTALQAASHGGHAKVVGQLLQAGADVNLQGGRYGSALAAARARLPSWDYWMMSSKRNYEMVNEMLLEHGARDSEAEEAEGTSESD
ncbi:MAG: hypothetical protein M1815_000437, partial [Lichina confinis]